MIYIEMKEPPSWILGRGKHLGEVQIFLVSVPPVNE